MAELNPDCAAHEMAFGKFLKRLLTEYKDVRLSDGQIYALYQECSEEPFKEIIMTGAAENLP